MKKKEMFLKPINNTSVVQQVIDRLTEAMITKKLRPGDRIPTEIELAETFGVGRNSIREAIKILVYLGVLEIKRADGTFVCSGFSDSMIDPMLYGIILDNDDSYNSLKELRELMEVGVVRLAIQKCNEKDVTELHKRYQEFEKSVNKENYDIQEVFEADNNFHEMVSNMGKNPLVDKINSVVRVLTHSMRLKTVTTMMHNGEQEQLVKVHQDIYEIIARKEESNINDVIRKSYFYEKGILEENELDGK